MALVEKSTDVNDKLSPEEYEFLFMLIKNSSFKGENLEFLYNLVVKLQNQYLKTTKSK